MKVYVLTSYSEFGPTRVGIFHHLTDAQRVASYWSPEAYGTRWTNANGAAYANGREPLYTIQMEHVR